MKRGFTLIELSVVLAILALVTNLAVREMSALRQSRASSSAATQLSELGDAVWRERPGEEPSGFLADLGRLPRATAFTGTTGRVSATLGELWRRPSGVGAYSLRRAVAGNLAVPAAEVASLADGDVAIACGWRGPYLRLPPGRDRLFDPWGNPMENRDDAGYDRLFDIAGNPSPIGGEVAAARHLGSDARADADMPPAISSAIDASVAFVKAAPSGTLAVSVSFRGPDGPCAISGDVVCRWYAPCGSAITGAVSRLTVESAPVASFSLGPGPAGNAVVAIDVGGECRARKRLAVPPGGRAVEIVVPTR